MNNNLVTKLSSDIPFLNKYIKEMNDFVIDRVKNNKIREGYYIKTYNEKLKEDFLSGSNKDINYDEKIFTFIMSLKNRSERAMASINSIVTKENLKFCDFIIVEDEGKDNLNLDNFEFNNFIKHYKVKTGVSWSRSRLLNYGIKRTKTPIILAWDADFLFPEDFIKKLINYVKNIDLDKYLVTINLYETENSDIGNKGTAYSSVWIYKTDILKKIQGFNENFIDHGLEERELQCRLEYCGLKVIYSFYMNPLIYVFHLSHSNSIRENNNKKQNYNLYYNTINNIKNNLISNKNKWGEQLLITSNIKT